MARSFSDEEVQKYSAPVGTRSFSDDDIATLEVKTPVPGKKGFGGFLPGVSKAFGQRVERAADAQIMAQQG